MSERRQRALFGVGGVTLLTVLLVLVLTMFAVLTLSSAQADLRLSEKNALAVREYYAADSAAVLLQAQAASLWPSGGRPGAAEIRAALADNYDVGVSLKDEGLMFFCDLPISETGQVLQLALFMGPPTQKDRWRVEQWQFLPAPTQMGEEQGLLVWLGD